MLQAEFVRSLQSNYERILLNEKPEEKKYQYCILSRGGIKGLLSCDLRYINGDAYLYYDISSMQSVAQVYGSRVITREWMRDFLWSMQKIREELGRFLLDDSNLLLYPQHIYQDLDSKKTAFLYVPYYGEENGFLHLAEFFVEHIDYEDEALVEYVYKVYEQYDQKGSLYLQSMIFEDAALLDREKEGEDRETYAEKQEQGPASDRLSAFGSNVIRVERAAENANREEKKGLLRLLESRKRKSKGEKGDYREALQEAAVYAVAEETEYKEEYGKTIYIEEDGQEERPHRLFSTDGNIHVQLDKSVFTIGKKKGESDLVLEDMSVSRLHARILQEKDGVYLEDMNSTNGTFKNGLRLQPYEKRKLEREDEIKIGKTVLIYR